MMIASENPNTLAELALRFDRALAFAKIPVLAIVESEGFKVPPRLIPCMPALHGAPEPWRIVHTGHAPTIHSSTEQLPRGILQLCPSRVCNTCSQAVIQHGPVNASAAAEQPSLESALHVEFHIGYHAATSGNALTAVSMPLAIVLQASAARHATAGQIFSHGVGDRSQTARPRSRDGLVYQHILSFLADAVANKGGGEGAPQPWQPSSPGRGGGTGANSAPPAGAAPSQGNGPGLAHCALVRPSQALLLG